MEKLSKLETDISYVSSLSDYPNSVDGLTSEELKATFDKGSNDIKDFINNNLTEEIDAKFETVATNEDVSNVVLGQIPDGTINEEKLDEYLQKKINSTIKIGKYNILEVTQAVENTNTFTLPLDLTLETNQRLLIETPSNVETTDVEVNTLNDIEINKILLPNQKYELVYENNKFEVIDNDNTLLDITLNESVSEIEVDGLSDKIKDGKLYYALLYNCSADGGTVSIFNKVVIASMVSTGITQFSLFSVNKNTAKGISIYTSGNNTPSTSSVTSISKTSNTIKFSKATTVGTRLIIKEA